MEQDILGLTSEEARLFLLRQHSFCSIGLPSYFDFQNLLENLYNYLHKLEMNKGVDGFSKNNICKQGDNNKTFLPGNFDDINYLFLQNKNGRYSWRPLQIINPVIYVCMVILITDEHNWSLIQDRFSRFRNEHINCYSLPLINHSTQTDTANTILNWWSKMEQQTIKLSLKFNYMMTTDIADCYASLYTHTISWALCGKDYTKLKMGILANKKIERNQLSDDLYNLGDGIDRYIRAMSNKQTNGIPQGSVLMDFIAEMVLGYADMKLGEKMAELKGPDGQKGTIDYKILRYRDDYRIFAKTQEEVVMVAKALTEVLSDLNFRLNTQKTIITQDIISGALKPDKLYYITHDYKRLEEPENSYTLQKHLLRIYKLSQEYPNSGSLQKAMSVFFKRVCDWKSLDLFKEPGESDILISIATNIAFNNPKVYKEYVAIVSKILSFEPSLETRLGIIKKILDKFHQLPNVGFLEIWLQRLIIKENRGYSDFKETICQYVASDNGNVWRTDWLKKDIQNIFSSCSIINKEEIDRLPNVIKYSEVDNYSRY